jgi:hypothetical protein
VGIKPEYSCFIQPTGKTTPEQRMIRFQPSMKLAVYRAAGRFSLWDGALLANADTVVNSFGVSVIIGRNGQQNSTCANYAIGALK